MGGTGSVGEKVERQRQQGKSRARENSCVWTRKYFAQMERVSGGGGVADRELEGAEGED